MTKKEITEYLKNTEFDYARANAALIACDLVFGAYAESDRIHKILFSPLFCFIWYEKLTSFYQILSKKNNIGRS